MTDKITREDVEELAKRVDEMLYFDTFCQECGNPMYLEVFWFDMHGQPYRICPKCNTRQYKRRVNHV